MITAGTALTHVNLPVTSILPTLAIRSGRLPALLPSGRRQHGTAALAPDGHTVTFIPAAGYTGPASFQYVADDTSDYQVALVQVMVNVQQAVADRDGQWLRHRLRHPLGQ